MISFRPELHTPTNLHLQIEEIYSVDPSVLVVGSLGRAGIYNAVHGRPNYEFEARNQHPLKRDGEARDIDVISTRRHDLPSRPYFTDTEAYADRQVGLRVENGEWILSANSEFETLLDPAVMEPTQVETIYGIPCTTIPPETLLALIKVKGKLREKDEQAFSLLSQVVDRRPTNKRLPRSLLAPFEKVHEINSRLANT